MHQQTKMHLQQLQLNMQSLGLWQMTPPPESAFLSEQPFALDTMSPTEWLQWIFIPRMYALIESEVGLPNKISITPYLEEALKEMDGLADLLSPISEIEKLLQK
ncbi:TPA: YqcC family protein [Pasteurella multocida]|uniref:YqcC family protein n=1 Tax=Pasteurella multocida TaxID=747 RepID=UPI00287774B5|nr:YqcC family protein [Pasteurella multocida]WND44447.1 YqcC family protein [Pasteurella multocida]HDR1014033.1 YqcC family protein [Pasteurella multocida]HDR1092527.1 YqcC family protein [Pasteurella multocida]HDR1096680.1 YqcC family protein [Pasteurella multocida]HDR1866912.1 YqcC family protein [Pasteurella multocida]